MMKWSSLGINIFFVFAISISLSATCDSKKENCSVKNTNLNEILKKSPEKKNIKQITKSNTLIKQEEIVLNEEKQNFNNEYAIKKEEKKFENPVIFIIVILGFLGMYYYFKENKKKRKK